MMKHGRLMIAVGIPLAREDQGEHDDEYKLGPRKHDSSDEQRPDDALTAIYHGICDGDEQMRQVALTLGSCLRRMGKAQARDECEHWYRQCCNLVDALDGDDSDGGDNGRDNREDDRDEQ
jgi:hypothetical protein